MKYKLITSDFDHTLANSKSEISKENAEAIAKYIASGGIFTVSTGRMYASIVQKIRDLKLDKYGIPIISFQGAVITDSTTGEHIYKKPMDRKLVCEIARYCEQRDIYLQAYSADNLYFAEKCEYSDMYCGFQNVWDRACAVGQLSDYFEKNDVELVKCLIMNTDTVRLEQIRKDINAYFNGRVVFFNSAPILIECVDNESGKGNALIQLAKKFNVAVEDTVAVGDAMNDLSMIKAAGLGVAVANAAEELKKAAGFTAKSNDENAIAQIIELALADKL